MKSILIILYFLVINTSISQNLVQQKNIRLVYPKTSIEAAKKIKKYIDSVPEIKNKFLNIYSKKYIILTTKQYEPILKYVNEFSSENQDKQKEFLVFKEKWFNKYYNIEKVFDL
jgi:mannose/fructose/N-acetylgalactosamine-specific phosphotransferase system component IIB